MASCRSQTQKPLSLDPILVNSTSMEASEGVNKDRVRMRKLMEKLEAILARTVGGTFADGLRAWVGGGTLQAFGGQCEKSRIHRLGFLRIWSQNFRRYGHLAP